MIRYLLLLLPSLLTPALAAPQLPTPGSAVVDILERRGAPEPAHLQQLRELQRRAPGEPRLAVALAKAYVEWGRNTSDGRYYGYAQAALQTWWGQPAPPADVRMLRAMILQHSHQFGPALNDLDAVVAVQAGNAQAWLSKASIHTTLGQFDAAKSSCSRAAELADALVAASCHAAIDAMTGRAAQSQAALQQALARAPGAAASTRAWALGLVAEIAARRSQHGRAKATFQQALRLLPDDAYLLAAYGDFLLEQKRPAEVLSLLRQQRDNDALLLRHALALRQLGAQTRALQDDIAELRSRFRAASLRGDHLHQREEARFALELEQDALRALQLARNNWAAQREIADARILLAAASAARRPEAAQPVLHWLAEQGTEDPILARLAQSMRAL